MKGFVAWLSSKFSILLFAVVVFSAFFVFFGMQSNFAYLDDQARDAESIARIIDSVCASPFPMETTWPLSQGSELVISSNNSHYYLELYRSGQQIQKAVHCRVENATVSNVTSVTIRKTRTGVSVA